MMLKETGLAGVGVAVLLALCVGCSTSRTGEASARTSEPARPRVDRSVPELMPAVNKPLPEAHLVDLDGKTLPDESLRKGKVVLIFVNPTCVPCNKEAEFLAPLLKKRQDISFYGVATLGDKEPSLTKAAELFAFKTFYDEGGLLTTKLGITRMPIKVFLEDGVLKESWGGASKSAEVQADFVRWLEEVK
jgi:thiol-disulfide isomerase/thioredoxin